MTRIDLRHLRLFLRRFVTFTPPDCKILASHLRLQCAPLPVMLLIQRSISNRVLVSKLLRDLCERIAHCWSTGCRHKSPASLLCKYSQLGGSLLPRGSRNLRARHIPRMDGGDWGIGATTECRP